MPKIIANPQERLMEEAQKQVEQSGYSAMTIRSVAKACDIGVGTVYNYFSSKDELLAACLLRDWKVCLSTIDAVGTYADSPVPVIRCIHDQLTRYTARHQAIFRDPAAAASITGSFSQYHKLLRSQLAAPLRRFCPSDFAAEFAAEALLTWTTEGKPFDELYGMIQKLF